MAICLRCKKEFKLGSGYTCQECVDRIAKIIKADVEKNQRAREEEKERRCRELKINDRFEILDL